MAKREKRKSISLGVIGYGGAYNMGRHHLMEMAMNAEFVPTAVCDLAEDRLEMARQEFPGIETYTSIDRMIRESDVELVAIILPHHMHAKAAIRCLNAGRHVVVEKPFAITVAECDRMIAAARRNKVMVSAYHNRHWDANILTIMKHLPKLGRPFRWESSMGDYRKPKTWWRSDKHISGGIIYDWGAHFTEWMLQVMDYEIESISGFHIENEVWPEATNEDEVEAIVRFKGDAIATHTASSITMADKDMIRITGTKGAMTASLQAVSLYTMNRRGEKTITDLKMERAASHRLYYKNVRDHLVDGAPLVITPEKARRVIQVLEYTCRSAASGRPMKPKYA